MTPSQPAKPIPVILDTDIGSDIDDTWALATLLKSPELDLRLVVTDTRDTWYRAAVTARFLEAAGRTDIPVGIGVRTGPEKGGQEPWVRDYDIMDYPGVVHTDGVGAMVSEIMGSSEPVTLIAIGPVPNLARALEREPRIAERVRFIGMHGSVRMGYNGGPTPQPECNVIHFVEDCRKVFEADWPMTITPLDTCGLVTLQDEEYQAVRSCKDPMIRALMENYDIWAAENGNPEMSRTRSSVLFDTVAAYLAVAEDLVEIEELGIRVTDEGMTVEDPSAKPVRCAMRWRSLPDFRKWLVRRLTA